MAAPRDRTAVARRLRTIVGDRNCITDAAELHTYASDALAGFRVRPDIVVLPRSTQEIAACIKESRAAGMAIVPRGSGTGLSGGALPIDGCLVIGLSRMNSILEIDLPNLRMRVQPGVINLDISRRLAPLGYYYAPDPSSQSVCSIGGNVAENSGGAHCLKYGFTTNHVAAVTMVLQDGSVVEIGAEHGEPLGYDLLSAIVGSEGMLGIVSEVVVKILRQPQATRTLFATFPSTDEAGEAVSRIIAAGIVPAAIEMCDKLAIEAIVSATGVDWPLDAGAILLVDVDGVEAEADATATAVERIAHEARALEVRRPSDPAERDLMWKGRKSAFAAVGRISPNYYVQDGVVPRRSIAPALREIAQLAAANELRVANVFHAGDGNLHPLVLYDARVAGEEERAERVAGEILRICLRYGGSITGEHGVGHDKAAYLSEMFSDDDLDTMNRIRCTFDPERAFNPSKVFPTPRLCGDRPGPYVPHATELAGTADRG
ncbi:MAG: FAD-binding protein [Candidatus Eremiobacteraeota bacterium]|nr:FAD-binding protein [Candidatus Eremiobacteraeota bacterium]